jgi:hypothetical protein
LFKGNRFPAYLFVILLILFSIGLYNLFSIRFRAGDIYPAYSSLRSDPLGTKVFFKSLDSLDDINVERNFQSMSKIIGDQHTTLFVLGITNNWMETIDAEEYRAFSRLAASGGRLVISLYPSKEVSKTESSVKDQKNDKSTEPTENKKQDKEDAKTKKTSESLLKQLGLGIALSKEQVKISADLMIKPEDTNLPSSIKCHPTLYFTELNENWNVIYARKDQPVIIEKKFGAGSIVLCADSYLFSNEAMMSDRYPGLLAWLAGQGAKIYFDESHFGITNAMGIADLARKYGLQGVFLVLLLITGLFIWKVSIHFIPPGNKMQETGVSTEKDHLDGLVGLLQRNISPNDLLSACVKEWEKSFVGDKGASQARISKVKEVISETDTHIDPVQSYNNLCKKISERKRL